MTESCLATKPHYPILDGLRGVAAVMVVIFHFFECHTVENYDLNPFHHTYLAVDFFFLLSGFVMGYAYDDRMKQMSNWSFFKIRLIRLHPLVVLAAIYGVLAAWINPYSYLHGASVFKVLGILLIAVTVLPTPDIRGGGETHSYNSPCWSLFQEYIANILFAVLAKRLNKRDLGILVVFFGIMLTGTAVAVGHLSGGWGYDTLWIASVRMLFSFFAGILLFRIGKLVRLPWAFSVCSLLLVVLFCLPYFKYNGLYEAACAVVAFPIIVAIGAGGHIKGREANLCSFLGDISYPLYITHYPIVAIYWAWLVKKEPTPGQFVPTAIVSFIAILIVAYASLKLCDEPVRRWLKNKDRSRKKA